LSWLKEAQRIGHEDDDDEDDDDIERVVWWLLNELFFDGCVAPSDELVSPTTVLCYVVFCFFDTLSCCVVLRNNDQREVYFLRVKQKIISRQRAR
jgi:hypothetical protein